MLALTFSKLRNRTFSENIDLRIFLGISLAQKFRQNLGKQEVKVI